jgi:hypothetical protein
MSFSITFDTDELRKELRDIGARQMPFALANALNATANDMQAGIRNVVTGRGFVIRAESSRQFLRNQIRREPGQDFANKRNPVARVRIANKGRASLLSLIDQGGTRASRFAIPGSNGQSLPIPARQVATATVSRALYPGKLALKATKGGAGARGAKRTFVVKTKAGDTLLLQRRGKRSVRTLFVLNSQAKVPGRQFFAPMAEKVALGRFDQNLDFALRQALKTAR